MATCPNITLERIRAKVRIGTQEFSTPDVKSFSINRSRGQLTATCSVTIEIPVTTTLQPGQDIKIYRIINDGPKELRFTGQINSVNANPVWEKANYYSLSIQASDVMKRLENRKFSRRFRVQGLSLFAAITSVTQTPNTQRGVELEKKMVEGEHDILWPNMNFGIERHSDVITAPNVSSTTKQTDQLPKLLDSPAERSMAGLPVSSYVIRPAIAIVAKDNQQTFQLETLSDYVAGATWASSDETIGTISDDGGGVATYTQIAAGSVTIVYTDIVGAKGIATAQSVAIHSHENLASGGPAVGVYKTE